MTPNRRLLISAMEMPIKGRCKGKMSAGVADREQVQSVSLQSKGNSRNSQFLHRLAG